MEPFRTTAPFLAGIGLIAYGGLLIAHWIFRFEYITLWVPDSVETGPAPPLLLLVAGATLALRAAPAEQAPLQRLASGLALALIAYPAAILAQVVFDITLGLDLVRGPATNDAGPFAPGQMAPSTCIAFIAAGCALLWARPEAGWHRRGPLGAAVALISLIGTSTLIGRWIEFEPLNQMAAYIHMAAPTSVGLCGLALGLWLWRERLPAPKSLRNPRDLARRIVTRAMVVLSLVAIGAGIAGFAMMHQTFRATVAESTRHAAQTQALALANTLTASLWFPRTVASRPTVIQTVARLDLDGSDAFALEFMPRLAASFLSAGIDGVRFLDSRGRLVGSAGHFPAETTTTINVLRDEGQHVELRWNGGAAVLHTETPVLDDGRQVGQVVTQRRLVLFDDLVSSVRNSSDTSDALICSRHEAVAVCAPTRYYPEPFTVAMFTASGEPTLPINRALLGEAGVAFTSDLRQVPVVAGYAPIGHYGLGLVVKVDAATLYAPLRARLNYTVLAVAALVGLGTWALKARVQPLLRAVVDEQVRTKAILDTSGDAFISLGVDGTVTDWNAEATRLFGWTANEVMGKPLGELIVPPELREAHARGFAAFVGTGAGPLVNRCVEMDGLTRDGELIPVEMSLTAVRTEHGYVANAFLRDIRERQAAERRLADSERRLADVLANIPAMVGHFDLHERCRFASDFALKTHGLKRGEEVGLTMRDALGPESYGLHKRHIPTVLSGRRVSFDGSVTVRGRKAYFQAHMVPERSASGDIIGFYLMSFDVTALKEAQLEQERGERRLRAIADNLPVMISYIDREERLRFLNRTFEAWTGIPLDRALDRPLKEVIGETLYEQRASALRRGLSGERVEFEVESEAMGIQRVLQTVYIPDMAAMDDVLGVYTLTTDVTLLRQSERRMAEMAMKDKLTGLANRRRFDDHLPDALSRAIRSHSALGLLILDVDHFKLINDTRGHACGDAVLAEFARRIESCVRTSDLVTRLAGDEFAVVLESLSSSEEAVAVAQKITGLVRQPLAFNGDVLRISTSIGIAFLAQGEQADASLLLACADEALYEAKRQGRDGYAVKCLQPQNARG